MTQSDLPITDELLRDLAKNLRNFVEPRMVKTLRDRIEALEAVAVQQSAQEKALVEAAREYIASEFNSEFDEGRAIAGFTALKTALAAYAPPAVTSEPEAPHDGRAPGDAANDLARDPPTGGRLTIPELGA